MIRVLAMAFLAAAPSRVTVHARTSEGPGTLEVRGADGGVLASAWLDSELTFEVAHSPRYEISLTRSDSAPSGAFSAAQGVFSIEISAKLRALEVETLELEPKIELVPIRHPGSAARYELRNRTGDRLWVPRIVSLDGEQSSCFSSGGFAAPRATLDLGFWDEACLLKGVDAGVATVRVVLADEREDLLRTRRFVARRVVRAAEIKGRWVPDAGKYGCICEGTLLGPERSRVLMRSWDRTELEMPDGGHRVIQRDVPPVRVGDHQPYVLPPDAESNPDFSGWQ